MREHPIEVNKDTEAWSLNGDLFYRKEDKKPFLGAVQAVEQQEKSLIGNLRYLQKNLWRV